jgi:aminoglycoside phosphotransferase family enzyme
MLYLPQNRMLNVAVERNKVTVDMLEKLAKKMSDFHREADSGKIIGEFGKLDAIRVNTDENFSQTEKYIGSIITPGQFERIKLFTDNMLRDRQELFNSRVKKNRIKDCHGDLHAAHICFSKGISIYDCIEFNDRFRYCDVASEIAFLAMDLDHYGRADLSRSSLMLM